MGIDDILKRMMGDELDDQLETQRLARPILYARSRGMSPQKVYAALRNRKLIWYKCDCGHRCVKIAEADEYFNVKKDADDANSSGIHLDGADDNGE